MVAPESTTSQGRSEKLKFGRSDLLNGPKHSDGGIPTSFGELEGGEAVIYRRSTALFRPLLSQINAAGGGRTFADGGILGSNTTSPSMSVIDYDLLAEKIGAANALLPAPRVVVDDINTVSNRVSVIEKGAIFS